MSKSNIVPVAGRAGSGPWDDLLLPPRPASPTLGLVTYEGASGPGRGVRVNAKGALDTSDSLGGEVGAE